MANRFMLTRRGMIGGAMAGGAMMALPRAAWAGTAPSRVLFNAKIHTLDPAMPMAEAVAISGGRIVAVGGKAEILALAGPATERIDAAGMCLVPGFIDTHNHVYGEVVAYDVLVGNPFDVEFVTIASIQAKLKARADQTPPGQWINGEFYDDTKIRDGRGLNRHDLDAVSRVHPIAVRHRGGHTLVVNTVALDLAKITRDTPNPFGGTFVRDASGDLTGLVTDNAMDVFKTVGVRPVYSPAQQRERELNGARMMTRMFARYGMTSVHHADEGGSLATWQDLRSQGGLMHRVSFEPNLKEVDAMIAAGIESGFGDEWIRIGTSNEMFSDGSFSERTMSRTTPYPGSNPPYYGNLTATQEQLDALVVKLYRANIRPNFHANGDVAIDRVLTAYERGAKAVPGGDRRPKITHCTNVNPDLARRIKALGVVPNLFSTYAYYNADKFHFYGKEMMEHMMAFRMLIDAGVPVTGGSDFPPGPFAPMLALQAMVTRKGWNGEVWGPSQAITVAEALKVMTVNGAYASFEEGSKGSITPGKWADMVLLDRDPATADPETIKDIRVVRTITGGEDRYRA